MQGYAQRLDRLDEEWEACCQGPIWTAVVVQPTALAIVHDVFLMSGIVRAPFSGYAPVRVTSSVGG